MKEKFKLDIYKIQDYDPYLQKHWIEWNWEIVSSNGKLVAKSAKAFRSKKSVERNAELVFQALAECLYGQES